MPELRLPIDLQWFAGEKTEKATPKKRQDARKKGQVAKSMELPSAFILLFTFMYFMMFGGFFKERIYRLFTVSLNEYMLLDLSVNNVMYMFTQIFINGIMMLAPILIGVAVIGIITSYSQFGFLLVSEPLQPKLSKLNPLEGAKRIFAMRALVEFLKSIFKLSIVAIVAYTTLIGESDNIMGLSHVPLENLFSYAAGVTINLGLKISVILIILAIFDYIYQKYEHEKQLKMSKQDIKDEHKKAEGDPLIKGKIRERQRRMAIQRMMQDVPRADVVITNPTHYAIAIRYDASEMDAPLVVAKGQDYIALKIKELAKQHNIVMMENKPLARALFAKVEIGEHVPNDLFQAVAEVLAYVYRIKRKI